MQTKIGNLKTNHLLRCLLPKARREILSTFFGDPTRSWYFRDLALHLGVSPGSIDRELRNLVSAGILMRRKDGNRVYFSVDLECPVIGELIGLFQKSSSWPAIIQRHLMEVTGIDGAFIFGSAAMGNSQNSSDIDLCLVGEVQMMDIILLLRDLEQEIGRKIDVTIYGASEFRDKLASGSHFVSRIWREPKVFLISDEQGLEFSG